MSRRGAERETRGRRAQAGRPAPQAAPGRSFVVLGARNVSGLRALRAVDDLELNRLALFEGAEAVARDSGVVHEHVASALTLDEPIALGVVEPLDLACITHRSSLLARRWRRRPDVPLDRVPSEAAGFGAQKKTASTNAASATTLEEPPRNAGLILRTRLVPVKLTP